MTSALLTFNDTLSGVPVTLYQEEAGQPERVAAMIWAVCEHEFETPDLSISERLIKFYESIRLAGGREFEKRIRMQCVAEKREFYTYEYDNDTLMLTAKVSSPKRGRYRTIFCGTVQEFIKAYD